MKLKEYGKEHNETILFLHGGGLSWWNFRTEAEMLCDRYHLVMPVLDGHADSEDPFVSIEQNAGRLIDYIDRECGGRVLLAGGLSLGGQILCQMLSQRHDLCRYAVIESASVIPSPLTNALIGPSFLSGYGLIRQKWFAKAQFQYLKIREDLFEDYYRDTCLITRENMIAFTKASTAYALKPSLSKSAADIRIVIGEKEQGQIRRSADLMQKTLTQSSLEVKKGLYHGEYSLNHPQEYVRDLLAMIPG